MLDIFIRRKHIKQSKKEILKKRHSTDQERKNL